MPGLQMDRNREADLHSFQRIHIPRSRKVAARLAAKLVTLLVLSLGLHLQTAAAQPLLWAPGSTLVPSERAPWVAREQAVVVNFEVLDPRSTAASVVVPLFDGQSLTLERSRVELRRQGNHTWFGKVRGQPRSEVVMTVVDGHVTGSVMSVDAAGVARLFQVASRSRSAQVLRLIDPTRFPPDHPVGVPSPRTPSDSAAPPSVFSSTAVSMPDTADFIDVMIVYSNQTATAAGSALSSQLQYAVDRTNLSYGNSGISTRVRLVHSAPLNFNEGTNTFDAMLNQLTSTTDGVMDEVHALRDTHGADLVSLFVERADACGIGWLVSTAAYGFTVVNRGCSGDNLTFAHELGHNLGARHDPYVDSSNTPYAYGHGYVYVAGAWRTVMAYNNLCTASNTSCTRLPHFSNPSIFYNSVATGTTSTHDNARVHNERALAVANFRTSSSTPSVQFDSANISVAEGGGSAAISVTRSQATGVASVQYSTSGGTAVSGADFTAASGTLSFAEGVSTLQITIPITDDASVEPAETFTVSLSNPAGMVLGTRTSTTVTITDNDVPSFRFGSASYSVTEGTSSVVIPVSRNSTSGAASVSYSTSSGSAVAGQDFTARSGTLTFKAGVANVNVTISITNDTIQELSESFTVNLASPSTGYALGSPSTATVFIADNDSPAASQVSFATSSLSVSESGGTVSIIVNRTGDTTGTATVNYASAKGTARGGSDFVSVAGTLTFAPGEISKTIQVGIIDDTTRESAETFTVSLSGAAGAALGAITRVTVTIDASD